MREKKSSAMVLMAALMAMSVSAATIELKDAQWSSMVVEPHNSYFDGGSLTSTTNFPRDPGFRWDAHVEKSGFVLGFLGIGADTNTMGITVNPGDDWSVTLENPGPSGDYYLLVLSAYVTSSNYTGWVIGQDLLSSEMHGQETLTLSWDLTTGQVSDPSIVPAQFVTITSVSKLGLVFAGDYGGGGEDMALQVGSTGPYNYDVWLEEQYPGFVTDTNKTSNPDGDALDNWNEYAFGGNPTNPADIGYPVEYGAVDAGETYMAYFHVQRKGTEDLDYAVETCDDLVGGSWSWTNDIGIIAVTNKDFALDFAGVTNFVPTDVDSRFIRLQALEK